MQLNLIKSDRIMKKMPPLPGPVDLDWFMAVFISEIITHKQY